MKPSKEITPMRRTLLLGIVAILLPIASDADTFDDCPRFQRSQSSFFCEAEKPRGFVCVICAIS
jgi:hypothetical protein